MGTALTTEQIHLLSRYTKEIVLCYDNDTAGKAATERAFRCLKTPNYLCVYCSCQTVSQMGKVSSRMPMILSVQGREAFEQLLSGSENGIDYRMALIGAKYNLDSDAEKVEYSQRNQPNDRSIGYTCRTRSLCKSCRRNCGVSPPGDYERGKAGIPCTAKALQSKANTQRP